jgi:DNA-binding transcriptional MerR regulator
VSRPEVGAPSGPGGAREYTVDELASEAGVPVRRVRFYAGKRLLPPPRLQGRVGLYDDGHLARLRLVGELQDAGYTLAAIEDFLAGIPAGADADTVELFGTLASPSTPGAERHLTREELQVELDCTLRDDDVRSLLAAKVLGHAGDGVFVVTEAQLGYCRRMLQLGAPLDALVEAGAIIEHHVGSLAAELQTVFRTRIVKAFDDPEGGDRAQLRALADALRPLTIQALVSTYHAALEREVRTQAGRDA